MYNSIEPMLEPTSKYAHQCDKLIFGKIWETKHFGDNFQPLNKIFRFDFLVLRENPGKTEQNSKRKEKKLGEGDFSEGFLTPFF